MFDAAEAPQGLQRARGRAHVALGPRGLERLAQSGSAKAFLPRSHAPAPEVVFLNTAGGVTGGDRLAFALDLAAGTRATATTQTAERAYASSAGRAEVDLAFTVGPGGRLDWLPQETILFDRAALFRRTRIDLAPDAACLSCETLVLGRAAMGETLRTVDLLDRREVFRAGAPVLIDPVRLTAAALARPRSPVLPGPARALATIAFVAPGAADALGPVRDALAPDDGIEAGASAWDGRLVIRALAPDAFPMRRLVARVLTLLGAHLPRVWQL